jgi:hypothetical protein
MADVMNSLFGMTPESLQAQRDATLQAQAMKFAELDPFQRATAGIFSGANRLGGAIGGMLGAQDPELAKAAALQGIMRQADTSTPEGLSTLAQTLAQQGFGQQAMQVMEQARKATTQVGQTQLQAAQTSKVQAEEAKLTQASQREEQLRTALAALPPEAADKDIEAVVRQFGNPDRIFSTLEKRQTAEASRIAKAELERDKAAEKAAMQQRDQEFRQQMAVLSAASRNATTDLQRQMTQLKIDELKSKQSDKAEAKLIKEEGAVAHANKVITDVLDAKNLVTGMTTGLIGKGQSFVPGTDAFTLKERISTIKANLGFDRLQQMRDASPTGGALGQVAVQELQALQSSVASLDVGLPKKELDKNLGKIQSHYAAWLKALGREVPPELTQTTQPAAGTWSIKPKQP